MKILSALKWFGSINALVLSAALPARALLLQPISLSDSPSPAGGSGDSALPVISADGRFVAFASTANNLVVIDGTNALPVALFRKFNVYLRDRTNGLTTLVSANISGTGGGNGDSCPAGISTNGQHILLKARPPIWFRAIPTMPLMYLCET